MDLSLFFFGDYVPNHRDCYRLLKAGAAFADRAGLANVWTPERHFHSFGGLYPNPSVTGAAVASMTERVGIRAGSVVAPLHHPVRIAEEWAVVDNLSGGRVGVSFASGWHSADFILRPEVFGTRKQAMIDAVRTVSRLWSGQEVIAKDGDDQSRPIKLFPRPLQPVLPMWLTAAGNVETFELAGELGVGILTHLVTQSPADLGDKLAAYRQAWKLNHQRHMSARPHVVLMLHTFIGTDRAAVRREVRDPLMSYLKNSLSLVSGSTSTTGLDSSGAREDELQFVLERSFDRYFDERGLFGTVDDASRLLYALRSLGVDEVACLVDFGVDEDLVMGSWHLLEELNTSLS